MNRAPQAVLALDVGDKRIGVAMANLMVRFANPVTTLQHDDTIWQQLAELIQLNDVQDVVVGLPRGLDGQETAQTQKTRDFMALLSSRLGVTVHEQDEAATSLKAKAELDSRKRPYEKAEVDALAATYILEDYLQAAYKTGIQHGV